MVAPIHRQDLLTTGVLPGQPDSILCGLGTAIREKDHIEIAGCSLSDHPSRLASGIICVKRRNRAELSGILLNRRHESGMLVSDVYVDELRAEVEKPIAVSVPEFTAERSDHWNRIDQRLRRPRMKHVRSVVGADCGTVGRADLRNVHGFSLVLTRPFE